MSGPAPFFLFLRFSLSASSPDFSSFLVRWFDFLVVLLLLWRSSLARQATGASETSSKPAPAATADTVPKTEAKKATSVTAEALGPLGAPKTFASAQDTQAPKQPASTLAATKSPTTIVQNHPPGSAQKLSLLLVLIAFFLGILMGKLVL
eukprot:m.523055 g.523055  ORF g.523055 m.523055 type:complete len:150 (+) comp57521_c1_seq7:532-981(+)